MRPAGQVQGEAVLGIGGAYRLGLGQGFARALGAEEGLAQRQAHPHVVGLQLQRLAEVQHRLVGLLGAGVDLAQARVGPYRVGLQRQGLLQRGGGLVVLPRGQELRPELDVGVEATGIQLQVALEGSRRVLRLLQLGVEVGQRLEGVAVARQDADDLFVLRGRLAGPIFGHGTIGGSLKQLAQDEVRVGVVLVEGGGGTGLGQGLLQLARVAEQLGRLHSNLGRGGIELGRLRNSASAASPSPSRRAWRAREKW